MLRRMVVPLLFGLVGAAILIGLAVDYGLVICQEAKVAGHDKAELRKAATKPVMFGALTTTVVFLALNLGGLPGMAQLGSIVAIGLSAAAILMLVAGGVITSAGILLAAVFAVLGGLAAEGRTVIAVTHDEGLARTAQRRIHLVDGRVVGAGAPAGR